MAGRKYSTWVEVAGTTRKEEPKFGSNADMCLDIYVGYGASDSTLLATIDVEKVMASDGKHGFMLRVDGIFVASVDANRRKWGIEEWIEDLLANRGLK